MPIPRKSLVSVDTTPSYHVVSSLQGHPHQQPNSPAYKDTHLSPDTP